MNKQRLLTDSFLVAQVVTALISGFMQFVTLLTTTQGVSISLYVFWDAFVIINLGLAWSSHKAQPSRLTRQTLATYVIWLVMVTSLIGAMQWGRSGVWDGHDTLTALLAGAGIAIVAIVALLQGMALTDPYVRGTFALCFRAVPQTLMAWRLATEGNDGFPAISLVMGHIAILTRLGQIGFSIREAGWNRDRVGSLIAEAGNELGWCAITVGWLMTA